MKKLFLSLAVTSALGLTGCLSDGDKAPVTNEEINISATRVVFDPGMGKLSIPTDILLGGTTDGTLMLPVANQDNYADPQAAISALDGWSTAMPFEFEFDGTFNENGDPIHIDGTSVTAPGAIRIHEAVMGADMSVEECAAVPAGAVCTITGELKHGEDFTVVWADKKAQVVPLRPFKPKTGYVVSITDQVVDEIGRSVAPSTTYYMLSKPLATDPIGGAQEQALQGMVNSQRGALAAAGVDLNSIVHSNSFTTQSVGDTLSVIKQMMLKPDLTPKLVAGPTGANAAQLLVQGLQLPNDPTNPSYQVASSADVYAGQVSLPYFSPVPTAANPETPLNGRWQATAVSPASIQIALNSGALTGEQLGAILTGLGLDAGAILADPRLLAGAIPYEAAPKVLYNPDYDPEDAESGPRGLDQGRHLTKFNPIPRPQTIAQVPLLMSVPNLTVANAVRAAQQLPALTQPADGWPVVIFQHGITGSKENFLAIAGTLAMFGHATIAIDHPLHGDRGFAGGINATKGKGSPTNYLNLASLLTARDNLRQSVSDLLGVRLSLSNGAANFGGAAIDGNNVQFVGHSLGAIAGHNFVALANTSVGGDLAPVADPLYKVNAAALGMPGVGIAPFLLESQSFGPLIGGMLSFQSFPKFAEFALEEATNSGVVPGSDEFMGKLGEYYSAYYAGGIASPTEQAQVAGLLAQFQFAAQTVVDSGDALNYTRRMVSSETPLFFIEAVNDEVIPNTTAHPLGGTEPMIRLLGLASVTESTTSADGEPVTGAARYLKGGHSGLLDPTADAASTQNQQTAIGAWFGFGLLKLNVDAELVQQ